MVTVVRLSPRYHKKVAPFWLRVCKMFNMSKNSGNNATEQKTSKTATSTPAQAGGVNSKNEKGQSTPQPVDSGAKAKQDKKHK
jgi:hypothetical protein